jgi:Pyridoxamine 5'-phosphate oxidase
MIPDEYADLLTRPLFGHLATVRPDGTPQANPMCMPLLLKLSTAAAVAAAP